MSTQRWEPGARAAIVISEHYENMNRVVTLDRNFRFNDGGAGWFVADGKPFKGYEMNGNTGVCSGNLIYRDELGIAQWKLRLLDEDEPVVIRDAREYAES